MLRYLLSTFACITLGSACAMTLVGHLVPSNMAGHFLIGQFIILVVVCQIVTTLIVYITVGVAQCYAKQSRIRILLVLCTLLSAAYGVYLLVSADAHGSPQLFNLPIAIMVILFATTCVAGALATQPDHSRQK